MIFTNAKMYSLHQIILDENGIYYSNLNLPGMTKTWPNINPRYGPKPVQTDFEAHAVAATAFVVMTYTQKARVKDAEQLGKLRRKVELYQLEGTFSRQRTSK